MQIHITALEKQVEEIDRPANEAGLTRSAFSWCSGRSTVISRGQRSPVGRVKQARNGPSPVRGWLISRSRSVSSEE